MRRCDLQRRLLSDTLNPLDAFNQAIFDKKSYYNHLKLTQTKVKHYNSGKVYKNYNTVQKVASLIIGILCHICKYRRNFERLCQSKGRKPVVTSRVEKVYKQNCPQSKQEENFCGVINAWTEEGISDNDDYSVLNIQTIYDDNCLETKKLVKIGFGEDASVNMNIPVDSASPVSFLKVNVFHQLKLRDPQLKTLPVNNKVRAFYCGFTSDALKTI